MPPKRKSTPEAPQFSLPSNAEAEDYRALGSSIFMFASIPSNREKYGLSVGKLKDKWASVSWHRKNADRFLVDRGDNSFFLASYRQVKMKKHLDIYLFGDSVNTGSIHGMRRVVSKENSYIVDLHTFKSFLKDELVDDWIKSPPQPDPVEVADFEREIATIQELNRG